ncbi:hypothetical protein [Dysosmobacter sp.]|uniref:hypothetical protein n=1 Tax=Dysosmobacter sp. TaxID=2591382 RepID=UPI002A98E612|nr:hypothetical protein [Dysosmobacter sp.]MDY5613467.1 hypothetical protein [Dysosmobacter sp.]
MTFTRAAVAAMTPEVITLYRAKLFPTRPLRPLSRRRKSTWAGPKEEGRKLGEQKKKLYAEYRKAKADMQEVTTIKANIDYLLGYSEPGRKKEQER